MLVENAQQRSRSIKFELTFVEDHEISDEGNRGCIVSNRERAFVGHFLRHSEERIDVISRVGTLLTSEYVD